MVTITQNGDVVTLINVFSCEPENQRQLIDSWIRATEETLGKLPGIISATLHRSKDGTRVVNYARWKSAANWEELFRIGLACRLPEAGRGGSRPPTSWGAETDAPGANERAYQVFVVRERGINW